MRILTLTAFLTLALSTVSLAQTRLTVPFPMNRVGDELAFDAGRAALLAGSKLVVVTGVPLSIGEVDLTLERVPSVLAEAEILVDGARTTWTPEPNSSCWRGRVAGIPDSEVYLALSPLGSRGWIRAEGEMWHLLAAPGSAADWSASRSRFATEEEVLRTGATPFHDCEERLPAGVQRTAAPSSSAAQNLSLVPQDILQLKLAVETDYQLFQKFASVAAETNYLDQLFAAASSRYDQDIQVEFQIVYLGLHSNANDGWTSGDTGAGSGAMLDEFRLAWTNNLPNGANLAHFASGAALGGGVAYLNTLCNPAWGFAVSGDLAGNTPFPVTQGPLSWDFMVFTHEIGHNFSTPHTHDFCPPIDTCAPSGYFGQCQTSQTCITNGTIMSYCHLCAGGMSNVSLVFHPQTAALMRHAADLSCLVTLCTAPANYCPLSPNSFDPFGAYIGYVGSTRISHNDFALVTESVPPNASALYFYGQNATIAPFGNGYRCIGSPVFRLPIVQANLFTEVYYLLDFQSLHAGGQISAGQTWNFQLWFRNPAAGGAGFNLSDSLRVQFCP